MLTMTKLLGQSRKACDDSGRPCSMTPDAGCASNHDTNLAQAQPGRVGPQRSVLFALPSVIPPSRKETVGSTTVIYAGFSWFLAFDIYPKSWSCIFACVYPILLNSFFVSPLPQGRHLILPTSCGQVRSQDYQTNELDIGFVTKFTSRVNKKDEIYKRLMLVYQLRPFELNLAPHVLAIHPSID